MTTRRTVPDPFRYGTRDIVTTVVQVGAAIAGVAIAITQGDYYALFGLAGLAGGAKGDLIGEVAKVVIKSKVVPVLLLVLTAAGLLGCGTTGVTPQFLVDTKRAVEPIVGQYLEGCQSLTVAPEFQVYWSNEDLAYGGGVLVGCAEKGKLIEFVCFVVEDENQKGTLKCEPGRLWLREAVVPPDH